MEKTDSVAISNNDQLADNSQSEKMSAILKENPLTDEEMKSLSENLEQHANTFIAMREMKAKQSLHFAKQHIQNVKQNFIDMFKDNPDYLNEKLVDVLGSSFGPVLEKKVGECQDYVRKSIQNVRQSMMLSNSQLPKKEIPKEQNVQSSYNSQNEQNSVDSSSLNDKKPTNQKLCKNDKNRNFDGKENQNEKPKKAYLRPKGPKKTKVPPKTAENKPIGKGRPVLPDDKSSSKTLERFKF